MHVIFLKCAMSVHNETQNFQRNKISVTDPPVDRFNPDPKTVARLEYQSRQEPLRMHQPYIYQAEMQPLPLPPQSNTHVTFLLGVTASIFHRENIGRGGHGLRYV